jgi:membrane protease YdiL (CAAX protease family)
MLFSGDNITANVPSILRSMGDLINLFSTLGGIAAVLFYCRLIEKRKFPTLGFRKDGALANYLVGLLVGTTMMATIIGICYLTGTVKFSGLSGDTVWWMIIPFFIAYLIQGMSEEVALRGFLLISVARRYSLYVAVIVSSVMFSLLHGLNPGVSSLAVINLTLFGFFAGLYFLKSGNIWGVAALHSAWNFAQGNIFGIPVSGTIGMDTIFKFEPTIGSALISGGAFGMEGGLVCTLVLLAGIAIVSLQKSRRVAKRQKGDGSFMS